MRFLLVFLFVWVCFFTLRVFLGILKDVSFFIFLKRNRFADFLKRLLAYGKKVFSAARHFAWKALFGAVHFIFAVFCRKVVSTVWHFAWKALFGAVHFIFAVFYQLGWFVVKLGIRLSANGMSFSFKAWQSARHGFYMVARLAFLVCSGVVRFVRGMKERGVFKKILVLFLLLIGFGFSVVGLSRYLLYSSMKKVWEGPFKVLFSTFFTRDIVWQDDYVYAGTGTTFSVFDAHDPAGIRLLKQIPFGGVVKSVAREGSTVYMVSGNEGLYVLDISSPAQTRVVGKASLSEEFYTNYLTAGEGHVYLATNKGLVVVDAREPNRPKVVKKIYMGPLNMVVIKDKFLYCALAGKGLSVFNLAFPYDPLFMGKVSLYVPEKMGPRAVDPPPVDLVLVGKIAYVANGHRGLAVVDVSDSYSPKLVSHFSIDGWCDRVDVLGKYLVVWAKPRTLSILNISNPVKPVLEKSIHGMGFPPEGARENKAVSIDDVSGFSILDVRNPLSPKVRGSYKVKPLARGVRVNGKYVYLASGSDGLHIYDRSDPLRPRRAGSFVSGLATDVDVYADHVFVANGLTGIDVIDVKIPGKPVLKKSVGIERRAWGISVREPYLYVAAGSKGLTVYNVKEPTRPVFFLETTVPTREPDYITELVGRYPYVFLAGFKGLHIVDTRKPARDHTLRHVPFVADVALHGNIAYLACFQKDVMVVDVRKPEQARVMNSYQTTGFYFGFNIPGGPTLGLAIGGSMVMGLDIEEDKLVVADYNKGVFVFDARDPANLKKVAHYRTKGHPQSVDAEGHYAYVADTEAGLLAINLKTGKMEYALERQF